MQLKNEDRTYTNVIEAILNPVKTIMQRGKRTIIWVTSQTYTDNEATGIIQSSPVLEIDEDFLIRPALSTAKTTNICFESAIFWIIHTQSKNGCIKQFYRY